MALFDTHCHYNLDPLLKNWQTHWQTAKNHQVDLALIVGADLTNSEIAINLAQPAAHLWASVGLHPEVMGNWLDQQPVQDLDQLFELGQSKIHQDLKSLRRLALKDEAVAIGETGLDYYYFSAQTPELNQLKIKLQQQLFCGQIQLANDLNLPLIVHTRDSGEAAYREVLRLVQQHYAFQKPWILHCASGPLDYLQTAIAAGAYVGFDGNITYKKNQALLDVFALTPPSRRLLETDAPFLPPVPHRGQTCEPWMVSLTAKYLQAQFGQDPQQLTANALTAFGL